MALKSMDPCRLAALGWKSEFDYQVDCSDGDFVVARVSAHHGSQVLLLGVEGELRVPVQLAESAGDVAVGDWLVLDRDHRAVKRLERHSLLYRKASGEEVKPQLIAANLDTVFIVSTCTEDFNLSRIERYLALAIQAGVLPIVVLTKADLCDDPESLRQQTERLRAGLLVKTLDARETRQAESLARWCGPGQTVALLGSSGVGKSTLANTLGATELATGATREKDGKGRHTTTARSLHLLPSGGVLVDNPGIRELQLPACEEGVTDLFEDVIEIASQCRFSNCRHDGDEGCAITEAIQLGELDERRFASFQKLHAEQAHHSRSLAERRERDRASGRFYKSVMKVRRRRRDWN